MTVFAFHTSRRASGANRWESGLPLTVHIGRDAAVELDRLSWRGQDSSEAAVVFQADMSSLSGTARAPDGTLVELRGWLANRWPAVEDAGDAVAHRFSTEFWEPTDLLEGEWYPASDLRLLVNDGMSPITRVSWSERSGAHGWLALYPATGARAGDLTCLATVITASAEYAAAGEVATNLVDGSLDTKWLAAAPTARVDFTLAQSATVMAYALTSANDEPDRDPVDWTLSGSDDGQRWTRLDLRAGQVFTGRLQTQEYPIRNTTAYGRYRLEISRNAGAPLVQLAGVRLFATTSGGFLGHYQRAGTAPAGYRGIPVPAVDTADPTRVLIAAIKSPVGTPPALLATPMGRLVSAVRPGGNAANGKPTDISPAEVAPVPVELLGVSEIANVHLGPELAQRWLALLRPAFGLDPRADGPVVAQLGGLPSLPLDVAWPERPGQGPLSLIASVDLGALPRGRLDIALPADGLLHFFYFDGRYPDESDDCHGDSRLVYVPPGTPVEVRQAPAGLPPYPTRELRAQLITTMPDLYHPILVEAVRDADRSATPAEVFGGDFLQAATTLLRGGQRIEYFHQLGGYSRPEQWPPEGQLEPTGRWSEDGGRLLAQFGSDDRVDMQWGDLGSLYWVLRPADIARQHFDAATFEMQCL